MDYIVNHESAFIRIDRNEDLFSSIYQVVEKEGWQCAHLSGIGAIKDVELGYYNTEKREYVRKIFPQEAELLSLDGNLSIKDDEPFLHIHSVLSGTDFQCFGGHLFSARIAVTCEVNVRVFDTAVFRQMNDQVGLACVNF